VRLIPRSWHRIDTGLSFQPNTIEALWQRIASKCGAGGPEQPNPLSMSVALHTLFGVEDVSDGNMPPPTDIPN